MLSLQVVIDNAAPQVSMSLQTRPLGEKPIFSIAFNFSKPIAWLQPTQLEVTNAVLLNMTTRAASATLTQSLGSTSLNALFLAWFKSLPGTTAVVAVPGSAYTDIAGRVGQQRQALEVG
jgi:hypothetical protein